MEVRSKPRRRSWLLTATLVTAVAAGVGWLLHEQRQAVVVANERTLRREIRTASQRGDWAVAERALAALSNPTPSELVDRATMLAALKRPDESAAQWERYAATSPDAESKLLGFVDLLVKQERISQAFDLLLALSDRAEGSFPTTELMLAGRLLELGFPVEAARRIERPLQRIQRLDVASRLQGARVFLSVGNADRAAELLQDEIDGSLDERAERFWLLSRTALQRGDAKGAADSREKLRSLGSELASTFDGKKVEPSPFVGSHACAKCHQERHSVQSASSHAATLALVDAKSLSGLPPIERLTDAIDPRLQYTFSPHGKGVVATAERDGGTSAKCDVNWKLGKGARGISFLVADGGEEVEFALSHYAGHGWDATTGHRADEDRVNPLGRRLSRLDGERCLGCHTSNVEALRRVRPRVQQGAPELPTELVAELGVRCESCHGPGLNHVRAAELGFKQDWAIRHPAKLSAAARVELCATCHQPSKNTDAFLTENLRFHSATLRGSKCFEASGKLSCVTCHDAHDVRPRPLSEHGKRCLECHSRSTLPCPPFAAPDSKNKGALHADAEAASCIKCHMPPTPEVMKHTVYTDHRIRVHREPAGASAKQGRKEPSKSGD